MTWCHQIRVGQSLHDGFTCPALPHAAFSPASVSCSLVSPPLKFLYPFSLLTQILTSPQTLLLDVAPAPALSSPVSNPGQCSFLLHLLMFRSKTEVIWAGGSCQVRVHGSLEKSAWEISGTSKEQVLKPHLPSGLGWALWFSVQSYQLSAPTAQGVSQAPKKFMIHTEIKLGKLWEQNESRILFLVLSSKSSMNLGQWFLFFQASVSHL